MEISKNIKQNVDGTFDITGACRYARLLSSLSNQDVEDYAMEVIPERYHNDLIFLFNLRKQLMIWFYGPHILLFEQFDNLARTKE